MGQKSENHVRPNVFVRTCGVTTDPTCQRDATRTSSINTQQSIPGSHHRLSVRTTSARPWAPGSPTSRDTTTTSVSRADTLPLRPNLDTKNLLQGIKRSLHTDKPHPLPVPRVCRDFTIQNTSTIVCTHGRKTPSVETHNDTPGPRGTPEVSTPCVVGDSHLTNDVLKSRDPSVCGS